MDRIWVARLSISLRTSNKINSKHNVTDEAVRDSVVCVHGLLGRWGASPTTGARRAEVETTIRGRPVLVVIYPVADPLGDAWRLGSVYFLDE